MAYEFSERFKKTFTPVVFRIPDTHHYVLSYYKLGHNSLKNSFERVHLNENDVDAFENFLNTTRVDKLVLTVRDPFDRFCAGVKEMALYRSPGHYNIALSSGGFLKNEFEVEGQMISFGDDHTYHYELLHKVHDSSFWKNFISNDLLNDIKAVKNGSLEVDVHIRPYICFYKELVEVLAGIIDYELVNTHHMTYYFSQSYNHYVPYNHTSNLSKLLDQLIVNEVVLNHDVLKFTVPLLHNEHIILEAFKKANKMYMMPEPIFEKVGEDTDDALFALKMVYDVNVQPYKNLKLFWMLNK